MPESNGNETSKDWLASMPNDSIAKTLLISISLCLVCSVAVSTVAVSLKPLQLANVELARQTEILSVAGLMVEGGDVAELFRQIETRIVDLDSGAFVDDVDPATFDARTAQNDPASSEALAPESDVAGIRRRAHNAAVYFVRDGDEISTIILPVHGAGLYSTLWGFLALEPDGNTIKGLTFYEDGETPGLGGEINNPRWQSRWEGIRVRDDEGAFRLAIVKSAAPEGSPDAGFQVDSISGATLTSRGVDNTMRFWLGDDGFGPFLARIAVQGDSA